MLINKTRFLMIIYDLVYYNARVMRVLFLCSPKGEHIVAALFARLSVTLLSGAYL